MKKINYSHLYIFSFFCWSILLLMRIYEALPSEKISQFSAQIELIFNFLTLVIVFQIFTPANPYSWAARLF